MWFIQAVLGLLVAGAVLILSCVAVMLPDERKRLRIVTVIRWLAAGFALTALGLAAWNWWPNKDWTHQLWASTHPQFVLFVAAGAFLVGGERRGPDSGRAWFRSPWILSASLLALAILPAALIQWAPDPGAAPRNVGRPFAGTLDVLLFGLGGPMPEALVPATPVGVARGMGYLPREITVPLGALSTCAFLWIVVGAIQFAGAWLRLARLRHAFFLLAPFAVLPLILRPLPFGIQESSVWETDPTLIRGFGPLVALAVMASVLVPLVSHMIRRANPAVSTAIAT